MSRRLTPPTTEPAPGSAAWIEKYGLSTVRTNRLGQLHAGQQDERVWSVEADLGDFFGFDFRDEFPDRWIDVGIAEASLIGVASGLALRGKIPMVNTFADFALMRACEQVRLEICYHNTNVKIFGTFAGMQSGFSGPTHHAIEDIAIGRALPGMTVVAPADGVATYHLTMACVEYEGPTFLRIGMDDAEQVYDENASFEIGKGHVLRDGKDLTLVAAGIAVVPESLKAAAKLAEQGIDARVIDMYSIKPIDAELLEQAAEETGLILTVEEHNVYGGLGGAVAETLATRRPTPMKILGIPDTFSPVLGTHDVHLAHFGLDAAGIAKSALAAHQRHKG